MFTFELIVSLGDQRDQSGRRSWFFGQHGDHFGEVAHINRLEDVGHVGLDIGVHPPDRLPDLGIKMVFDVVMVPRLINLYLSSKLLEISVHLLPICLWRLRSKSSSYSVHFCLSEVSSSSITSSSFCSFSLSKFYDFFLIDSRLS